MSRCDEIQQQTGETDAIMNTQSLTHGNAYTSDPDYEQFLGAQYERTVYDWLRRRWIRCTMQAPKTPKDNVPVNDPNETLAREQWIHEPGDELLVGDKPNWATDARRELAAKRHAATQKKIVEYITRNGPSGTFRLSVFAGRKDSFTLAHLKQRQGTIYCICGKKGKSYIWGLVGIHDQEIA